MIPKIYYAFNNVTLERIDQCLTYSRLDAAKIFSNKKQIQLKDWINIYSVYPYKYMDKLLNKNIHFSKNNIELFRYKCHRLPLPIILRFNSSGINIPKCISRNNFISFMEYMKKEGWKIEIEK